MDDVVVLTYDPQITTMTQLSGIISTKLMHATRVLVPLSQLFELGQKLPGADNPITRAFDFLESRYTLAATKARTNPVCVVVSTHASRAKTRLAPTGTDG